MSATPIAARFPIPLPDGWFMIAYSDDLEAGAVRPVRYFGRELVLFRSDSGRAALLDAFCPHLGAHLGHGGQVSGESVKCPFHGWEFDTSGACSHIPYAEHMPRGAHVANVQLNEHSGRIWAWHSTTSKKPFFEVPEIPEAIDESWELYKTFDWTIRSCLQEMSENGTDSAHFVAVHDMREVPEMNNRFEGPFVTSSTPALFPTGGKVLSGNIDVHSSGMGCDVIRYSGGIELLEVVCTTPIDTETVDVRMDYMIKTDLHGDRRKLTTEMADYVAWQFTKDIPIWENKILRTNPMLCDGDGPIPEFRRWCQQFYGAETAPTTEV